MLINILIQKKNIELFQRMKIYSEHELKSRKNILLEQFVNQIVLEAQTVLNMINTGIVPCVLGTLTKYEINDKNIEESHKKRKDLLSQLIERTKKLDSCLKSLPTGLMEQAEYCMNVVRPNMRGIRELADELEKITDSHVWPFPSYLELIYDHHYQGENEVSLVKDGTHYL